MLAPPPRYPKPTLRQGAPAGGGLDFFTSKFLNWDPKTPQKIAPATQNNVIFGIFRAPDGALHQKNRACGAIFLICVDFRLGIVRVRNPPSSQIAPKKGGFFIRTVCFQVLWAQIVPKKGGSLLGGGSSLTIVLMSTSGIRLVQTGKQKA